MQSVQKTCFIEGKTLHGLSTKLVITAWAALLLTIPHSSLSFSPLSLQTIGSAIPSTSNHYGTTHSPGLAFLGNSYLFAGVCGFSASHHVPSVSSAVYCEGTFAIIT